MKPKLLEHFAGMLFVTLALLLALVLITSFAKAAAHGKNAGMGRFGDLSFVDFNDPFQRALLKDVINLYYPGRYDSNDSLFGAIVRYQQRAFSDNLQDSHVKEHLSAAKFGELLGMYAKFLLIYLLVMALTYYGVQTLAVWRFAYEKRVAQTAAPTAAQKALRPLIAFGGALGTVLLFCPAYVIAYSIRTEFNTDTVVFMVLLGVISNGVLVTYANKFHAFLVAESRRGYVETAIVKNCNGAYSLRAADGIPASAIFRPIKRFKGHVFDHIFRNARYQYLSTIKEQASFLITGLIIIEMALNIHGHLCYEMLRQLLYRNYSIVVLIILGIFYTVKLTEIGADYLIYRETLKYENREEAVVAAGERS
jgi:hypothetical protein